MKRPGLTCSIGSLGLVALVSACALDPDPRDQLADERAQEGSDPDGYVSEVLVPRPRVEGRVSTQCVTSVMSTECSYNGIPLDQDYGFNVEVCLQTKVQDGRHEASVTSVEVSDPWLDGASSGIRMLSATLAGKDLDGDLLQIDLPQLESFRADMPGSSARVELDPAHTRMEVIGDEHSYSPVGIYLNMGGYVGGEDLFCDTQFNVLNRPPAATVEQIAVYDDVARVREVPRRDDGTLGWDHATDFRDQSSTELGSDGSAFSTEGVSRFVWNGRIYAFEAVRYANGDFTELRMASTDRGASSLVASTVVTNTDLLPGSGPITAITSTIQRNVSGRFELMQTFWREDGGYIRTVPLTEGSDVQFPRYDLGVCADGQDDGCWSDPVLPDPEDSVLSAPPHSHQLVIDGEVLVQGIWVDGKGWTRSVPAPDQVPQWSCGASCPWAYVGYDTTVKGQSMFTID